MPAPATRDLIVETADRLFYEGGYEATSFAHIAERLGISRGNFYHHFKTKDDILDAVIARRIAQTRAMLDAWEDAGDGPRERILSFVRMLIANRTKIMAFGCPAGTLCAELAKLDHGAQHRAAEILGLFRDWLAEQFRALGAGEAAEEQALHLLGWAQGVAVLAAAFRDEAMIRREVAAAERWLDALPYRSPPHDRGASMFVTFLKFTEKRASASSFMAAHNAWIAQGFADGVFVCAGSLEQGAGGAILATGESRSAHEARLRADPFVEQGIVTAETHEIDAKRTIPALDFVKVPA